MTLECMLPILASTVFPPKWISVWFPAFFFGLGQPNRGKLICQCLLKVEYGILITRWGVLITCFGRLQRIDGWFYWKIEMFLIICIAL